MKSNNRGFTLAELLIVVAIIAVLVAIAIPVFTAQLEKSREATDLANLRAGYAQAVADILENPEGKFSVRYTFGLTQKQNDWQNEETKSGFYGLLKGAGDLRIRVVSADNPGAKYYSAADLNTGAIGFDYDPEDAYMGEVMPTLIIVNYKNATN